MLGLWQVSQMMPYRTCRIPIIKLLLNFSLPTMMTMKKSILSLFVASLFLIHCQSPQQASESSWTYADKQDAVAAAPASHEILLENEKVRVLKVRIKPGEKEPMHTHQWESIMTVEQPARIRYYNDKDSMLFESQRTGFSYAARNPQWMAAEGLHAVENIDSIEYVATRIELKQP